MEDYEVRLEQIVENKQHLDDEAFKNMFDYINENIASIKLLDLILKYLKLYPQQILLIPQSNINFDYIIMFLKYLICIIFFRIIHSSYIRYRETITSISFIFGVTT